MRMRTIHPTFWRDKRMAKLAPAVQLAYIGLWQLCDDGGWGRWDVEEMAAELYPYKAPDDRERELQEAVDALVVAGRVEVLLCGHIFIKTLSVYQTPGRPTYFIRDEHRRRCKAALEVDKGVIEKQSAGIVRVKGSVVKGSDKPRASAREETTPNGGGLKARLGEYGDVVKS